MIDLMRYERFCVTVFSVRLSLLSRIMPRRITEWETNYQYIVRWCTVFYGSN